MGGAEVVVLLLHSLVCLFAQHHCTMVMHWFQFWFTVQLSYCHYTTAYCRQRLILHGELLLCCVFDQDQDQTIAQLL
jgi:hypothetical protein